MNHRSEYIMTTRKNKCAQKRSVLRTKGLFLLITDGVLKINTSFSRKELDSPILRLISLCLSFLSLKTLMPKHSKEVLRGLLCIFSKVLEALKKWQSISVFRYPMGKHLQILISWRQTPNSFKINKYTKVQKKNKKIKKCVLNLGSHFSSYWTENSEISSITLRNKILIQI